MSSLFVVREVYEQVVEMMTGLGSLLEHRWGLADMRRHGVPNNYGWLPEKTLRFDKSMARGGAQENRTLFPTQEAFEVHCWGETHEAAFVMRSDVAHVIKRVVGGPGPFHHVGSEWLHQDEDETTIGNVLIATFALDAQMIDEFVGVAPYQRKAPQSLSAPLIPNTQLTSVVIRSFVTKRTTEDGTLVATDVVTQP